MSPGGKTPLISVIMPVWGVEKYLARALDSLLAQSYENFEIVAVDDGSPDSCGRILDEYAARDARVRPVHQENRGVSGARNRGLAEAKGELISFVDPDDYVAPDFLEYLYSALCREGADVASCGVVNIQPSGKEIPDTIPGSLVMDAHEALERMCYNDHFYVTLWDKLYKRELFEGILFDEGKLFEDTGTTYRVIRRAKKICYAGDAKYFYVTVPASITTSHFSESKLDYVEMAEKMASEIESEFPDLAPACNRKCLHAYFSTLTQLANSDVRHPALEKELTQKIRRIRWGVSLDRRAPKRDKAAIVSLLFGFPVFSAIWKKYRKVSK